MIQIIKSVQQWNTWKNEKPHQLVAVRHLRCRDTPVRDNRIPMMTQSHPSELSFVPVKTETQVEVGHLRGWRNTSESCGRIPGLYRASLVRVFWTIGTTWWHLSEQKWKHKAMQNHSMSISGTPVPHLTTQVSGSDIPGKTWSHSSVHAWDTFNNENLSPVSRWGTPEVTLRHTSECQ